VALTPSSAANFFRSVIQWLQVGYPDGVPGPDRLALLELLRSSPLLSDNEITEVVDAIDEEELSNGSTDRGTSRGSPPGSPPPDGRCSASPTTTTMPTRRRPRGLTHRVDTSITKR
jgi:hypothetical protein